MKKPPVKKNDTFTVKNIQKLKEFLIKHDPKQSTKTNNGLSRQS